MNGILLLLLLGSLLGVSFGVDCAGRQVCDPRNRRIIFILDASLSISKARFNSEMVDYVINTNCAFTADGGITEVAVNYFNLFNENLIPFGEFTPNEFEAEVNRKVRNKVNLMCCTTHAEASMLAQKMFDDARAADPRDFDDVAIFITDGTPYLNYWNDGSYKVKGNGKAMTFYNDFGLHMPTYTQDNDKAQRGVERAHYAADTVPAALRAMKAKGTRVFFIGVPHKNPDKAVQIEYFKGTLEDDRICYINKDVNPNTEDCAIMEYKPLVSTPVDDHAFAVTDWDLEPLITLTLQKLCLPFTPPNPTPDPTPLPTPEPTPEPTLPPSPGPPVANPTPQPTRPTRNPTRQPTDPNCSPGITRDLMILVDTSDSMDPNRYRNEMMEIVKEAASHLDFAGGNSRIGVATFGHPSNTQIRIPLQHFSNIQDFDDLVDSEVSPVEPRCCTNLAEAFAMVGEHFSEKYQEGHDKVLIVITDGTPFQNYGKSKWMFNAGKPRQSMSRCQYITQVVTRQAELLHEADVRVALAGVPNVDMRPPMEDYFNGNLAGVQCVCNTDTNKCCIAGTGNSQWCSRHYVASIPSRSTTYSSDSIVTPGDNLFITENWKLDEINDGMERLICSSQPNPTNPPTLKPTTAQPVAAPVDTPTPPPVALTGFDLLVILDASSVSAAQQERCRSNGNGISCQNLLINYANQVRNRLFGMAPVNQMGFGTVSGNCYKAELYNSKAPWARREKHHVRRVRDIRDAKLLANGKCLTGSFMLSKEAIEMRADQNRKVAVVLLSHDSTNMDSCAVSPLVEELRDQNNIDIYAVTVGDIRGSHQAELRGITGSNNRIYDAFADSSSLADTLENIFKA